MDELVSIEPQFHTLGITAAWTTIDLKHELHPDATGVIFSLINKDIGAERYTGLRAKGSAHVFVNKMTRHKQTWGIIPVANDRQIEYLTYFSGIHDLWIMGYTGPNVHFLEPPVDITPPLTGIWTIKDLSASCPNAKAIILEAGAGTQRLLFFGCRCNGSTDNRPASCGHVWPVIKCDATQKIEVYVNHWAAGTPKVYVIGYITDNVTMETNALNKLAGPTGSWKNILITDSYATPKFAFLEINSTAAADDFGAQKRHSLRDILYDVDNHNWPIIHCNDEYRIELYRKSNVQGWWLQGVSH